MSVRMDSRELCETAIWREKEVEHVPFCPPFQGYWALDAAGLDTRSSIEHPQASCDAQIRFVKEVGIDGVETMWDWLAPVELLGCDVKIPKSGTIPTVTHIIDGPEDMEGLEAPEPESVRDFYRMRSAGETTRLMAKEIGEDHFLMASLVNPFTLAGELRGVSRMMMDCYGDLEFAKALVEKVCDICKVIVEEVSDWEVDAIICCDPTASGDMISGDDYHHMVQPSATEFGRYVRENGKIQINHICGDTMDRLDHVADTGCASFSLDYQVDIGKAVSESGDRMSIIGNLDPAGIIYSGNVDDVVRHTEEIVEDAGKTGFLFGSGCDIPVGSPIDNVKAISETLRRV